MSEDDSPTPATGAGRRRTHRLGAVATLLSILCLAGVLTVGTASGIGLSFPRPSAGALPDPGGERLSGQVAAVRTVPIVDPGGIIAERFPAGAGLDDPDLVRRAAADIVAPLGVDEGVLYSLWWELEILTTTDPTGDFPYRYPGVRRALAPLLTDAVVNSHRDELHELASLMELAAASPSPGVPEEESLEWAGAAAYEIWSVLAEDPTDCDAHLDLAALVSLGQFPDADAVDELFANAVQACPGDPTARWLWVHNQTSWASSGVGYLPEVGLARDSARSRPLVTARDWQRAEPGSALAWAAEAESRVTQAEAMQRARAMPFTARADGRRALELYEIADDIEHDPAFVVGQARALAVLGNWEEAADRLARAVVEEPDDADVHTFYITALERAGRFAEAAASARVPDTATIDRTHLADEFATTYLGLEPVDAHHVTVRDLSWQDVGAGGVEWLGYVPEWRADGVLFGPTTATWCRGETVLRDEILAGRPEAALESDVIDTESCDLYGRGRVELIEHPELPRTYGGSSEFYRAWAQEQVSGEAPSGLVGAGGLDTMTPDDYHDNIQNLWRFAGDLSRADGAVASWRAELPDSPWAMQRSGEIAFLRGDYGRAAEAFAAAAAVPAVTDDTTGTAWADTDRAEAYLDRGTALDKDGRDADAVAAYEAALDTVATLGEEAATSPTAAFAHARLGAIRLAQGRAADALDDLRTADRMVRAVEGFDSDGVPWDPLDGSQTAGVDANNLAVALLDVGDEPDEAVAAARRALAHDPESPVYLDTVAQAYQLADQPELAIRSYRRALVADPTVYQSWNNLGVLLAGMDEHDRARHAFRQAVTVEPGYARGWWNLGVELGRGLDPRDLVASQRALSTAVRLDGDLRGAPSDVEPDFSALMTGLDLSRAVSADWTFAGSARAVTTGLSWIIFLVALLRLALALGLDRVGEWVGVQVLGSDGAGPRPAWAPSLQQAWSHLNRFTALRWAMVASLLIVVWPLVRSSDGHWLELTATSAALASSLWLSLVAGRLRAVRAGFPVEYRGWGPGMAFGAVSSLVGYAFVPVPVNSDPEVPPGVRWSGPVVLAALAGGTLAIGVVTGGPMVRMVGVGVLAMVSTTLFPARPFDGGYLRSRRAGVATAAALLLVSGAVILGWA